MIYQLLLTLLLLPTPPGKKVITGSVTTGEPKKYTTAALQLLLKDKGKVIGKTYTDSLGNFTYSFSGSAPQQVDVLYSSLGISANAYLKTIDLTGAADTTRITLILPAPGQLDASGKTICPKCNKSDETIVVLNSGITAKVTKIVDKNGNVTYSPIVGNIYYMGSCVGTTMDPGWHCKRDNIFF
ncbi:hypothetical protein HF324_14420 [Chitinophaga oryzae]|uniref:Uncharacterized protein n=1 Tax=Chitinophaga oryzae TaxID=2725414 RepID=A0AAE6ZH00_9BACT|nr:hypothetical protein [Chitinophaga oryzae]QJB32516.1 hypothetical protein HF329_14765 [Chitinophaga oryzae]QJB38992.1 hypothetical protein HF324_14420 [Chitinophaga oryzae]